MHLADRVVTELGSEQRNSNWICEDARLIENLMDRALAGVTRRAVLLARPVSMLRSVTYDSRSPDLRSQASRYTPHCRAKRVNVIGPVWLDSVIVFGPLNVYAYSELGGLG